MTPNTQANNPLVTPRAVATGSGVPNRTAFVPLRTLALAGVLLSLIGVPAAAQVTSLWNQPTRGVGIAVAADDATYTADFEQAAGADLSVTKRDAAGALLWTARFDQTDFTKWERADWIEADASGNAIVCGTLMSGISNPVVAASILMKWSPQGVLLWRRVFDGPFDGSQNRQCAVDASGAIFVLGLGTGPNGYVTRLRKYSSAGNVEWTYFDPIGIGFPLRMKATLDGGFLISARSPTGSLNGFAKVDAFGNHVWHRVGLTSLAPGDAASDAFGNSYLANSAFGAGGTRLVKVDTLGNTLWDLMFPLTGSRVEVGPDDAPVVSGFPSPSSAGAAFFKASPSGQLLWSNLDADGREALLLHGRMLLDASGDAYLAAGTLFQMAVCKVRGTDGASVWTALASGGNTALGIAFGRNSNSLFMVGGTTVRLRDATEGFWRDEGQALASNGPSPVLTGSGLFAPMGALRFDVRAAPISTDGVLVVGLSQVQVPLFGGILAPSQDVLITTFTDSLGRATWTGTLGSNVPPGLTLYLQAWFLAPQDPLGFRASNTVAASSL